MPRIREDGAVLLQKGLAGVIDVLPEVPFQQTRDAALYIRVGSQLVLDKLEAAFDRPPYAALGQQACRADLNHKMAMRVRSRLVLHPILWIQGDLGGSEDPLPHRRLDQVDVLQRRGTRRVVSQVLRCREHALGAEQVAEAVRVVGTDCQRHRAAGRVQGERPAVRLHQEAEMAGVALPQAPQAVEHLPHHPLHARDQGVLGSPLAQPAGMAGQGLQPASLDPPVNRPLPADGISICKVVSGDEAQLRVDEGVVGRPLIAFDDLPHGRHTDRPVVFGRGSQIPARGRLWQLEATIAIHLFLLGCYSHCIR